MNLLDIILQHFAQQQAGQQPQVPAAPPPQVPITPIVQALTNGGGELNKIKNARNNRQRMLEDIGNL